MSIHEKEEEEGGASPEYLCIRRGLGECLQKILDFKPSETASGALSGTLYCRLAISKGERVPPFPLYLLGRSISGIIHHAYL